MWVCFAICGVPAQNCRFAREKNTPLLLRVGAQVDRAALSSTVFLFKLVFELCTGHFCLHSRPSAWQIHVC